MGWHQRGPRKNLTSCPGIVDHYTFPFDRLYEMRTLILRVKLHIVDRQKDHLSAIEREVGKPVRVIKGNADTAY